MSGVKGVKHPHTVEKTADNEDVREIAERLKLSVSRAEHLMVRYVLDHVSYNDFATYVRSEKERTSDTFIKSVTEARKQGTTCEELSNASE